MFCLNLLNIVVINVRFFFFVFSNNMVAGDKIPGGSTTSTLSTINTTLPLLHDDQTTGMKMEISSFWS